MVFFLFVSYQFADFVLAVRSRAGRGPDHGGGLIVGQLLDAALSRHNVAHLQRDTQIQCDDDENEEKTEGLCECLVSVNKRGDNIVIIRLM